LANLQVVYYDHTYSRNKMVKMVVKHVHILSFSMLGKEAKEGFSRRNKPRFWLSEQAYALKVKRSMLAASIFPCVNIMKITGCEI